MPIDAERLYAAGSLAVRCRCGFDNRGTLTMVDRYSTDFPPVPRGDGQSFIEVYRDGAGDPDDRLSECPKCGDPFDRDTMVEVAA